MEIHCLDLRVAFRNVTRTVRSLVNTCMTWPRTRADSVLSCIALFDRSQCNCVEITLRTGAYCLVILATLRTFAHPVHAIDGAADAYQPISGRHAGGHTDALHALGVSGCLLTVVHVVGL
jgi:hypothetical protein